jgi:hypothetical protein
LSSFDYPLFCPLLIVLSWLSCLLSSQERTIKKGQKRGQSREDKREDNQERTIKRGQKRDCLLLIVVQFFLTFIYYCFIIKPYNGFVYYLIL